MAVRRWTMVAAGVLALAISPTARASSDDEAAAAALFDRGLNDMMAGHYATACPALAESFRLDPRAGSLFTLAECEAKAGRVATARVHYTEYLARYNALTEREQERQRERRDIAVRQVDALAPRIARLTISPPAGAGRDLVIHRDGAVLGPASVGVELPVDPGDHTIVANYPDGAPRETTVHLEEGERKKVVLSAPPRPPPQPTATRPQEPSGRRVSPLAWISGGVGIAGLAVGSTFGALTLARRSTIDQHCVDHVCDAEGKSAADAASTSGTVSTVGFVVGGVGLVGAAVLFLTAPHGRRATTTPAPTVGLGPGGASVGLGGAW